MPRALDKEELRQIVQKYAHAALRVKKAGFDMVELHGGTGYLLAQFVSPRTNKRTDEYGGALDNRQRFPLRSWLKSRARSGFPRGLPLSGG